MVEFTKKRVRRFSARGYFIIFIFLVIGIYLIFFSGLIKKDCKQDKICFEEVLKDCKSAKFINLRENNLYEFQVIKKKGDLCEVNIELKKMGVGTPIKIVEKFEGKSMKCLIPRNAIAAGKVDEIENIINYCSGSLKEAIFELIIDRMYGLIIKNLGEISEDVKADLFEIK